MSLSSSLLVAQGSAGHWGYLISVRDDGQEEVVLPPAPDGPAMQPTPTKSPKLDEGSASTSGYEIMVPVDSPRVSLDPGSPVPAPAQKGLPELRPDVIYQPEEMEIPAISLTAPVVPAKFQIVQLDGQRFQQWLPPNEFAAGWHTSSATLGRPGNTVLDGHNNIYGSVFDHLRDLKAGNRVYVTSQDMIFVYEITNILNLPEKYESLETRIANARWLQPSQDERLTLVTCWPPRNNTNRLIIVARPVNRIDRNAIDQSWEKP